MSFLTTAIVTTNAISTWELYLLYRQQVAHRTRTIPPQLEGAISQASFDHSQAYSQDKILFSTVHKIKNMIEGTASLLVLPRLWYGVESVVRRTAAPSMERGGFLHAISFSIVADLVSTLTDLPFSYYETFVLEAKHGFNKTTKMEFAKDRIKSLLLRIGIVHPLTVGLMNAVVRRFGTRFPLYLFGGAVLLVTAATYVFPVVIQPLFNKFTPLPDDSALKKNVEVLARKLQFPLSKVFEVDGSRRSAHSNAYFYGFFNNKRIVLYDTLLKQLSEREILAVLCHEFGHWKCNHTLYLYLLGLGQIMTFCYGARIALFDAALFRDFGFEKGDVSPFVGFQLFSVVFFEPLSTILEYAMSLISRRFEFQADAFAVEMGYGDDLRASLLKMQEENKSSITPDWLFATLHNSHPPLVERLAALDALLKKTA